jgi:hypothetical protein
MEFSQTVLISVLVLSFIVGVSFIRQAFIEKTRTRTGTSIIRKAGEEIMFRLRLAAGAGLLMWVMTGAAWLFINWK